MRWFRRLFQRAEMDDRDKRLLAAAVILAGSPRSGDPEEEILPRVKSAILEADELMTWLALSDHPDSEVLFD